MTISPSYFKFKSVFQSWCGKEGGFVCTAKIPTETEANKNFFNSWLVNNAVSQPFQHRPLGEKFITNFFLIFL